MVTATQRTPPRLPPMGGNGRPISLTAGRSERVTSVPFRQLTPTIAAARVAMNRNAANVRELRQHIGRPDFYNVMARMDRPSAARWNEMAQVQARFQAGEPRYNQRTRTYSESMRESLHRAAIGLYQQSRPGQVYDAFIAIHPAVFNANGAFQLSKYEQAAVLGNTDARMGRLSILGGLVDGTLQMQNYARLANQSAELTRVDRERRGLPITPR